MIEQHTASVFAAACEIEQTDSDEQCSRKQKSSDLVQTSEIKSLF